MDFDSTIEELMSDTEVEILEFGSRVSSKEYNEIFEKIEQRLNLIYEKLRMLEDVKNYCREYLLKEIHEKKELFEQELRLIEKTAENFQDKNYVAYSIDLTLNNNKITDRNNQPLSQMNIIDGNLCGLSQAVFSANITDIKVITEQTPRQSTYNNLKSNSPCRSSYIVDEPVVDGIKESYRIMFESPIECNYIKVDAVNCQVTNVYYLSDAGEEITATQGETNSFIAAGIKFDLCCSNFRSITDAISNNLRDNFNVLGFEYNKNVDEELNIQNFMVENAAWQKQSNEVEQMNLRIQSKNGGHHSFEATDRRTNRTLNSDNIKTKQQGVLERDENNPTKFSYIPAENIDFKIIPKEAYSVSERPKLFSEDVVMTNRIAYDFGIDSITVGKILVAENCGFVSDEVFVGKCDYIKLEADITEGDDSVEYYIIDGAKEIPIMPSGATEVNGEKIFPNMLQRFPTTDPIILKKDNMPTDIQLEVIFDNESVYTVDYVPTEESDRVFITTDEIQLKIICRRFPFSTRSSIINSIIIKKYGGETPWSV